MRTNERTNEREARATSTSRNGHIAAAVAELLAERDHLAARLEKVNAAIAAVRDAFHLPAERHSKRVARTPGAATNDDDEAPRPRAGALTIEALQAALRAGPAAPGDLARTLGITRARLRVELKSFEDRGLIVGTGSTANRRIALPPGKVPAAKEAP